jgi:hypothetical protein
VAVVVVPAAAAESARHAAPSRGSSPVTTARGVSSGDLRTAGRFCPTAGATLCVPPSLRHP